MDTLTKSCFENGLSATEWLAVLQASPSYASLTTTPQLAQSIADTLLSALLLHPLAMNQTVLEYLAALLKSRLLPLHVYTPLFLRFTRKLGFSTSSNINNNGNIDVSNIDTSNIDGSITTPTTVDPRSIDMLCQLTISMARDELPMDNVLSPFDPVTGVSTGGGGAEPVSATLLDGYNLLQRALDLPYSTLHDLQASSSQVLLLLLQYGRSIISQLNPQETLQILAIGHEIMQHPGLNSDLIHALESTNRLLGEIFAVTDPLPPSHPEILGIGLPPQDLSNPVETSDIVSCSLLLRHVIDYRTHPYGCGNLDHTVCMLVGLFRWTGSPLPTFCAEVIQASALCFLESFQLRLADPVGARVWTSFIYGRLPLILQRIIDIAAPGQHQSVLQPAITTSHEKLSGQLQFAVGFQATMELDDPIAANQNPSAFPINFLHYLVTRGLLSPLTAKQINNDWIEENKPPMPLQNELGDSSMTELIDRLAESEVDEQRRIYDLLATDYGHQEVFAEELLKKFTELDSSTDIHSLSTLCEGLISHSSALDIIALHTSIPQLLQACFRFLDTLDWENIDDPQTAIAPFGSILLFLQSTIGRYKISLASLRSNDLSISADYLVQAGSVELASSLNAEERTAYQHWYKALFDPSSEGIDDSLVRSTNPKLLLKLSPVLISEAILACQDNTAGSTELESLRNGINYFQEQLLSWTLVGVIRCVALQMERKGIHAPIHAEVLQRLLKDAPIYLLKMVYRTLTRALSLEADAETLKAREGILTTLNDTLKPQNEITTLGTYSYKLAPSDLIQAAFMSIRASRSVSLDIPLCLKIMRPTEFLMHLHRELYAASQLGEAESSKRIAAYTLSYGSQSSPDQPWLLPIYTTFCIPRILSNLGPQDALIESLASAVTSSFRLCLCVDKTKSLGGPEPSLLVCQRFAQILKKMMGKDGLNSAAVLWKNLQSNQAFISQFPYFP